MHSGHVSSSIARAPSAPLRRELAALQAATLFSAACHPDSMAVLWN